MAENYDRGFDALFQGYYGQAEEMDLMELARRILAMPLNADRVRAGTIESKLVKILADFDGPASITLDYLGFRANDGMRDTVRIGTDGKAVFRQVDIANDLSTFSSIRLDTSGLRANDGVRTTFEIDTQGKAYFRGDITSDATITGATIRTGQLGTDRIELIGSGLRGLNSSNQLHGLVFGFTGNQTLPTDVSLYRNGSKMLELYDNITGYTIRPGPGALGMGIGSTGKTVSAIGTWDFTGAYATGLVASLAGGHSHGGSTGSGGAHGHGIPNGTILRTADGGTVTFVHAWEHTHGISSDGSHAHEVN